MSPAVSERTTVIPSTTTLFSPLQIGDLTFQILLPHSPPPQRSGLDTDLSISDFVIV